MTILELAMLKGNPGLVEFVNEAIKRSSFMQVVQAVESTVSSGTYDVYTSTGSFTSKKTNEGYNTGNEVPVKRAWSMMRYPTYVDIPIQEYKTMTPEQVSQKVLSRAASLMASAVTDIFNPAKNGPADGSLVTLEHQVVDNGGTANNSSIWLIGAAPDAGLELVIPSGNAGEMITIEPGQIAYKNDSNGVAYSVWRIEVAVMFGLKNYNKNALVRIKQCGDSTHTPITKAKFDEACEYLANARLSENECFIFTNHRNRALLTSVIATTTTIDGAGNIITLANGVNGIKMLTENTISNSEVK